MPYLGNDLQVAQPSYRNIDDISGSFNSSTTSFPLLVSGSAPVPFPINSNQCLISVAGVVQRPDDSGTEGFRISSGNIIFSSAPSTGADFFGVILAGADYVNVGANFPSGSAAVPSITFDSDLDTGIYNSAANQVSITTAGTERLRIDSAGQIESVSLGSASAPAFSFTTDPNTGIYSPGADQVAISTNGTGRLFVNSSGSVGIGTSSPSTRLHVSSADASATYLRVENTGGYALFGVDGSGNAYAGAETNDAFGLVTNGSYRMYITAGGNVGIGNTAPNEMLTIGTSSAGGNIRLNSSSYGNNGLLNFFGTDGNLKLQISTGASQGTLYTPASTNLAFEVGGNEKARIDSSGRLLVGTTSPPMGLPLFHVQGSLSTNGLANFANNTNTSDVNHGIINLINTATGAVGNDARIMFSFRQVGSSTGLDPMASIGAIKEAGNSAAAIQFNTRSSDSVYLERMRISNNGTTWMYTAGNAVISAHSSTGAGGSDVIFRGRHSATSTQNGTDCIYIFTNGNIQNTNGSYGAISDIKLKENIVDANSQWDDLKAMRVRNYNLKEGQTHTQIGLVAQEVELVSPGLVSESPDRDAEGNDLGTVTKSVNYSVLYMKAVKALQEAMERIEVLEQRLTDAGIA